MRMSDWVATAEAMPVRLTSLFQPLSRGLGLAGLVGCVLLAPITLAERGSHITLDEPLPQPAWELPLIANGEGTVTDSTYLGRVTYVDFWASWCGPCRLSLPALNRLSQEFDSADFGVVAISVDYVDEDALDFLKRYPVDYPVAIDKTGNSGRDFAVAGMPSGYLIGRDGLIREVHIGFRKGDEAFLRKQIQVLISDS
jgi:thiol-disulfide isomerase/thioredoxin